METMKAIAKRKSTRAFNPEKGIAKADLDAILAAGCAAPVGAGDYSSLHLTIIQSNEMLDKINELGIGPQGFGGRTTAIGLNIETMPTHIAGMPCAININCHVTRHKTEVI